MKSRRREVNLSVGERQCPAKDWARNGRGFLNCHFVRGHLGAHENCYGIAFEDRAYPAKPPKRAP